MLSKEQIAYYRSINMPLPREKIQSVNAGEFIIQHMTQSYDEHGNVIVVEGDKEDLRQSIPQFQDQVGPKNILAMINAGADADKLLNANKQYAIHGNFSDMDAHSVNEFKEKIIPANSEAQKALDAFNKKYGTSLDIASFLDLYNKGLLKEHIEGVQSIKESDGDKNE